MKKRDFLLGASIILNTYLVSELKKYKVKEKIREKDSADRIRRKEKIDIMKVELDLIFAQHEKAKLDKDREKQKK